MKLPFHCSLFVLFACAIGTNVNVHANDTISKSKLPIGYLVYNHGQVLNQSGKPASNVLLFAKTDDIQFFVTEKGLTFVFTKRLQSDSNYSNTAGLHRIDADLVGAHIQRNNIEFPEESQPAFRNYFNTHNPNGIRNVREYKSVR